LKRGDVLVGKATPEGRDHADAGREAVARHLRREGVRREGHLSACATKARAGTVIDVQVFTREGIQRDKRAQQIIDDELKRFRLDLNDQLRIVEADAFDRIEKLLIGRAATTGPQKTCQGHGTTKAYLSSVDKFHWFDIRPARRRSGQPAGVDQELPEQTRHSFDLAFEEKRKKLTKATSCRRAC